MHFITIGEGYDAVFLHGWGGGIPSFLFVAKQLNCRCTLVDFYGFGKSAHPNFPLTVADYARGVLEILKKQGIKKAAFIGHSFGGRVAIEIAASHPELVSRLVLVDSAGIKPKRTVKYYLKVAVHKVLKLFGKGLKGSDDYRALSPVMKKTFINVVNYDQTPLLSRITAPTAIFWGDKDKQTPPYMAKKMNRLIADSHIFWLTNAGHFSYLDNSVLFVSILKAFLEG